MIQALKNHGIDDTYILLIKEIYENSFAAIKTEFVGQKFKINRGLKLPLHRRYSTAS